MFECTINCMFSDKIYLMIVVIIYFLCLIIIIFLFHFRWINNELVSGRYVVRTIFARGTLTNVTVASRRNEVLQFVVFNVSLEKRAIGNVLKSSNTINDIRRVIRHQQL